MERTEVIEAITRLESGFMRPSIEYGEWIEIDGNNGIEIIPADIVSFRPDPEADYETIPAELSDYCQTQHCHSITLSRGYGARLSAPGYLDATEWIAAFKTRELAEEYLAEMYGDDC